MLRLRLENPLGLRLRLEKQLGLRLRLEKQPAKLVPAKFPVKTPAIFVLPQASFAAPAGFSSAHDETRYLPRCGAHKGPIAQK